MAIYLGVIMKWVWPQKLHICEYVHGLLAPPPSEMTASAPVGVWATLVGEFTNPMMHYTVLVTNNPVKSLKFMTALCFTLISCCTLRLIYYHTSLS